MRKALIASLALAAVAALVVATTATGRSTAPSAAGAIPGCAKDQLGLLDSSAATLTIGADNPAYPPWFGGDEKTKPWKVSDPYSGLGYEPGVAYAIAQQLGFAKADVKWTVVPFNNSYRPGQEAVRLLHDAGLVQPAARKGGRLLEELLLRQPVARGAEGQADRIGEVDRRPQAVQARRADRDDERRLHQERDQARREQDSTTRTTRPSRRSRAG